MRRFTDPLWLSFVLQLLVPGLGHIYWKEYVFGLFVFLIMLLTTAIFFVTLLIPLATVAKLALLGLPLIFYLFGFLDLAKSARRRRGKVTHSSRVALIFVIIGVAYQLLSPSAPGNFLIRNYPTITRIDDTHLAPLIRPGAWVLTNRAAYRANVFFLSRPLLHDLPEYTDLVAYKRPDSTIRHGMVMVASSGAVEVSDGILYLDGSPINDLLPAGLSVPREWPLTTCDETSILVATFSAGAITAFESVSLGDVVGKVHRLL